jgi:hypothetical protein
LGNEKETKKVPASAPTLTGNDRTNSQSPVGYSITRQDTKRKEKIMDFFFILLSLALTFGICWLIDRENMANYAIVITFLEICNLFWLVFPKI